MTSLRRLERPVPTPPPTDPPVKAAPAAVPSPTSAAAKAPAATSATAATSADRVAVTTPKQDRPPVDQSLFAVVVSPDRQQTFADIRPDVLKPIGSWKELPAVLKDLRERSQQTGQAVVLDLAVHGNNGTGLKVVTAGVKGEIASITSMAEVNRMVKEAGFAPGEIVLLTEGCNVHRSWTASADGFTATEKQAALHQAERLATSDGTKLAAAPEVVDHGPVKADPSYLWLGRGPGTNWISTVFLQYVTGKETGAPLQDLRQYKDAKAPLATQTEACMQVAGMRPEMIAALRGTRFEPIVAKGGLRFMDRLMMKAAAQPTADDSAGPSAPPVTQGQPPAEKPASDSLAPHGPLVPVQIRRRAQGQPMSSVPANQVTPPPAEATSSPVPAGPRFIDRLRAIQR